MSKGLNRFFIVLLLSLTISLAYVSYDLYSNNNEKNEEIMKLKEELLNTSNNSDNNSNTVNNTISEDRIIKLTLEELESMTKNKESFILIITQKDCTHCNKYKPTLNKVLTDTAQIAYEIDIQTMSLDEKERVYNIARVASTPTTIFIEEGEEKDTSKRLIGNVSYEKIYAHLQEINYIQ